MVTGALKMGKTRSRRTILGGGYGDRGAREEEPMATHQGNTRDRCASCVKISWSSGRAAGQGGRGQLLRPVMVGGDENECDLGLGFGSGDILVVLWSETTVLTSDHELAVAQGNYQ